MDSDNERAIIAKVNFIVLTRKTSLKKTKLLETQKLLLKQSRRKKNKHTLFAVLGRSILGKTVLLVLSTQDLGHSFSQYGPPGREIIYICVSL